MRKTRKLLPANYRKNWAKKALLSPCKSGRSSDYACAKCVHRGPSVAEVSATLNAIVLGLGGCFSLFMLVALDHLPSLMQAGALNVLIQGGGFVLAAMAPLIKAQLQQISSNWMSGWLYQVSVAALVLLLVMRFNPRHYAQILAA